MIINIVPENLHQPFFPPEVYVKTDLLENTAMDTPILDIFAVDLDPGNLGLMDFSTDNDLFRVDSMDGKSGSIVVNGYDACLLLSNGIVFQQFWT